MRFASLDSIRRDAAAALRRFPLTLAFAWLACGLSDALILTGGDHPRLTGVAVVATLGIALSLAVALFSERLGPRVPAVGRGALLAIVPVALAVVAWRWTHWTDDVQWRRYAQLSLLGHALVAVLPFARVREPNGFWQYNRTLLERFVVATVFSGVLLGGLTGALGSLKPLFNLAVSPKAYALLTTWVYLVFHPWFFLAGIPAELSSLESRREYPATLRVFAQFILVPLVAVYQVLLTGYLVKVIVTGRWPSGLIGWLVSVEATAGMLALLLVHPVRDQEGNLWTRTFSRGFYLALLPSVAMLAVSIAKRVGQYGVTEDRYFVIVLTGWLAAMSLTFIVRRDADIRVIPFTLALFAAVTLGGPWGAYRVSLRSQRAHLLRVLESNGLWHEGGLRAAGGTVPFAASQEISSTVTYLIRSHGSGALRPLFGDVVAAADSGFDRRRSYLADQRAERLMSRLGLPYVNPWQGHQAANGALSFSLGYVDTAEAAAIRGFDYHARLDGPGRPFSAAGRRFNLGVDPRGRRLVFTEARAGMTAGRPRPSDTLGTIPLDPAIAASRPGQPAPANRAPLRLELSGPGARGIVRVTYLMGYERPALSLHGLSCDLYFTLLGAGRDSGGAAEPARGSAGR